MGMTPTREALARALVQTWEAQLTIPVSEAALHDLAQHIALTEQAQSVSMCGTCGGVPPSSGLRCVCGGGNTIYAEVQGLREALFEQTREIERLRTAIDAARRESASDPGSIWARNATVILNEALRTRAVGAAIVVEE